MNTTSKVIVVAAFFAPWLAVPLFAQPPSATPAPTASVAPPAELTPSATSPPLMESYPYGSGGAYAPADYTQVYQEGYNPNYNNGDAYRPFPGVHTVYPQTTDYNSVVDTHGWPVPTPYRYYPQGAVGDDGVGIYQCLAPADCPDACFCTPPPCYFGTLYFGGKVLDRRTNLRPAGIIFDTTFTTEYANTSDFDLETEAGFMLGVWLTHPSGLDWNFEYFNVSNFEDTITRTDAATLNVAFFGGSLATPTATIVAEYQSNLDSIEMNWRARHWRGLAPLIGFRFLQVDEDYNLLTDATSRTGLFSQTDNELYGFQFGCQGLLYEWSRTRLETTLKVGTYYNDIDVSANVAIGSNPVVFNADPNAVAFAGDGRVTLVHQLGPRVTFRIGYQFLWLDGVALGPNQANYTQTNFRALNPPVQTVDLSSAIYQGGDISFEVTW